MGCVFEHLGGCSGRLDPHHVVTQNRLKREFPYGARRQLGEGLVPVPRGAGWVVDVTLDDLLEDRRNIVPCCRHHHDRLTSGGLDRLYLDPPESAIEFAKELGLESVLEKARERRSAA